MGYSVSLGMVTFNEEKYVEKSVLSILGQTFTDFELNISDNGSEDKTLCIIKNLAQLDSRIKLHPEVENKGALYNFRKVRNLSKARYFSWVAGHDIYPGNWLEEMYAAIKENNRLSMVTSDVIYFSDDGLILRNVSQDYETLSLPQYGRIVYGVKRPSAGNRVYGLQDLEKTKKIPVNEAAFWDKIYMSAVEIVGATKSVKETCWFRRENAETVKNTMINVNDKLSRQIKILPSRRHNPSLHLFFPQYINKIILLHLVFKFADEISVIKKIQLGFIIFTQSKYPYKMSNSLKLIYRHYFGR